jgi:hypothetical protein
LQPPWNQREKTPPGNVKKSGLSQALAMKKSGLSQAQARALVDSQELSASTADCPSIFSQLPGRFSRFVLRDET